MNKPYYNMIFKRKSFHLFRNIGNEKISRKELSEIEEAYRNVILLCSNIRTEIRIVPANETSCKRGQEYCILFYSEKKFRKDMFKSKRKLVDEIWCGEQIKGVTDIVRFATSACNTQPWAVEYADSKIKIF